MGRMFHQALLARGVPTQMVIYPDENHGIKQPKQQVDVLQRTLAWFAAHDVNAPVEIVMLGDSITKGVRSGVTAEQTFAAHSGEGSPRKRHRGQSHQFRRRQRNDHAGPRPLAARRYRQEATSSSRSCTAPTTVGSIRARASRG